MENITSKDNQRLKHLRRVRDGQERTKVFIEGQRLADEALRSDLEINEVFASESFANSRRSGELLGKLEGIGAPIYVVSDSIFPSITDTKTSQGIILTARRPADAAERIEKNLRANAGGIPLVIVLFEVNNPANLGAIVRTMEAAGAAGVIVTVNSADAFSPKAVRGSMGSIFRIPVWQNVEMTAVSKWVVEQKLRITTVDIRRGLNYTEIDWVQPRLLVFGSEARGLKEFGHDNDADSITIPMKNSVESLNLAVAAGIILFEACRQIEESRRS